jgi:hypothetical protein
MSSDSSGRFYEENEAEEILRLASRDSNQGRVDRERLLSMAAELGIAPEAVERAEAEWTQKRDAEKAAAAEAEDRAEYRRHRRSALWSNLGSYLTVNLFLVGIWFYDGPHGGFWPFWVIFPWGMWVVPSALFGSGRGKERDFQRWRRRRHRSDWADAREPQLREVLDELAGREDLRNSKLMVIQELRQRTGVDLDVAKEAVEEYAAEHDQVVW